MLSNLRQKSAHEVQLLLEISQQYLFELMISLEFFGSSLTFFLSTVLILKLDAVMQVYGTVKWYS